MAVSARLDSIRIRLIGLLVAIILPIAAMAVLMTWVSDHKSGPGLSAHLADVALDISMAGKTAMLDDVRGTLQGLAGLPDIRTGAPTCGAILTGIVASQPARFVALALVDAAGQVRCSTAPGEALQAVPGGVSGTILFGPARAGPASHPVLIPASLALAGGRLLALIDPGVLPSPSGQVRAWLLDGKILPPQPPDPRLLPDESAQTFGAAPFAQRLRTRGGGEALYAARLLVPGLAILVGVPTEALATALPALPVFAIGALLIVAIVLMALGVEHVVIRPLHLFDRAVRRWRDGGMAETRDLGPMPRELRTLTISFAQATSALAAREAELRAALAHQELLMQEVHHRVKNNLQIVASLLNLQASRIRQPEARVEFQSARDRVRALATLHRHLYGHGELHTINMREFLNELCLQLFQSFKEEVGGRIALAIDATELQMSSDQAVPIALLVTEAVSNALKYAFPDGRTGRIRVALAAAAGGMARLVIEDDGIGLPGEGAGEAAREGIGMQLIRGFARQLGAVLAVSHEHGTRYEIEMKIMQARAPEPPPDPATKEADAVRQPSLSGTR